MIDEAARNLALRFGIPVDLQIPIAAADEAAISTYIGEVVAVLGRQSARRALLVRVFEPPPRDGRYPIWRQDGYDILHQPLQVWVKVAYGAYRRAYRTAFPDEILDDRVLSHAMNRRIAVLKGFRFVRLTPTSRRANSSSAVLGRLGCHTTFHAGADGG
jgi:hypothetical protein